MQYNICILITILVLFGGVNFIAYMGIDFKLFQSLLIVLALLVCCLYPKRLSQNKQLTILSLFVVAYSLFKLFTDKGEGTRMIVIQLLGTPLLLMVFPLWNNKDSSFRQVLIWRKLFYLLFFFYIGETGMAIMERVLGSNILGWKNTITYTIAEAGVEHFRSTALHGHPLYNSLIVSTCMAFILVSPLKLKYKFGLWFLGYMAILCFNTRGSIVGNVILFMVYICHSIFVNKQMSVRIKKRIIILSLLSFIGGLFLILNLGFGGRLLEMGLIDDSSAQTRIDVWQIFDFVEWDSILWGISHVQFEYLKFRSGLYATENFWIDQMFRLGLIFLIIYIILYYKLFKRLYAKYDSFSAIFTSSAFLLIASTNNSLSSNFIALFIWFLLINIFNPLYFRCIMPTKYIQ